MVRWFQIFAFSLFPASIPWAASQFPFIIDAFLTFSFRVYTIHRNMKFTGLLACAAAGAVVAQEVRMFVCVCAFKVE